MADEFKAHIGWRESRIVKGFWRSWSWIAAVSGFVVAVIPDLASYLLLHTGIINTAFPKLTPETKDLVLSVAVGLVIILRPFRQKNMPSLTIPVAVVPVPDSVAVGPARIQVTTEVVNVERAKPEPGAGG